MNDTRQLLFMDSGEGHVFIKRNRIAAILFSIGFALLFSVRFEHWQLQREFYWLWDEIPRFPFFAGLLILPILFVASQLATNAGIRKAKINVYNNGIDGYAFKIWSVWPKVHVFELTYDEIKSVKKRKGSLTINSTKGRYCLTINNPEDTYQKITEHLYEVNSEQ